MRYWSRFFCIFILFLLLYFLLTRFSYFIFDFYASIIFLLFMATKVVHRFLRQPNIASNIHNRVANRYDPFNNTLTVLKDPKANRELYLIGTTNSSTLLAYRTKKLIEKVKPSSLYVQATSTWWNTAKHVEVFTL